MFVVCALAIVVAATVVVSDIDDCGVVGSRTNPSDFPNLIYHGTTVEVGGWPWQVAIAYRQQENWVVWCGGSLASHLHIVTAASCFKFENRDDRNTRNYKVFIGESKILPLDNHVGSDIIAIDINEHYNWTTLHADIAVLTLKHRINYTEFEGPVCLDRKYREPNFAIKVDVCYTAGYGNTGAGDSAWLRQSEIMYTRRTADKGIIEAYYRYHKRYSVSCQGDTGNGLWCPVTGEDNGKKVTYWMLQGVTSWRGPGKCGAYPAVYTFAPYFYGWLRQRIDYGLN